ncbi:unnamed protein product [Caenorhabditis auriculariae]|uniref:Uncharacterized protein n=1 Tax=Caenorhabditis auriculariae TaxID=2777116 RepID=A0A8S1HC48_9PELO|nr:unnamed protein product [Caenorhabditis auriculariae]
MLLWLRLFRKPLRYENCHTYLGIPTKIASTVFMVISVLCYAFTFAFLPLFAYIPLLVVLAAIAACIIFTIVKMNASTAMAARIFAGLCLIPNYIVCGFLTYAIANYGDISGSAYIQSLYNMSKGLLVAGEIVGLLNSIFVLLFIGAIRRLAVLCLPPPSIQPLTMPVGTHVYTIPQQQQPQYQYSTATAPPAYSNQSSFD